MEAFANIISLISGFLYRYYFDCPAHRSRSLFHHKNRLYPVPPVWRIDSRHRGKKGRTENPFPLFKRLWFPPPPVSEPATWSA